MFETIVWFIAVMVVARVVKISSTWAFESYNRRKEEGLCRAQFYGSSQSWLFRMLSRV